MKKGITIISLLILILACENPPGEGGTSAIKGRILVLEGFLQCVYSEF